jgi:phosphate-selective porin OprO/OprP
MAAALPDPPPTIERPIEIPKAASPAPAADAAVPAAGDGGLEGPAKVLSLLDLDFRVGPWKFRGYAQYDAADYMQAPAGPPEQDFRRGPVGPSEEALRARQFRDGSLLRRARLGGEGTWDGFAYRAMFELGSEGKRGDPHVVEVWLAYRGLSPFSIQAGAFPQPANMGESVSFDSTLFLERPMAVDLSRSLGAGDGRLGLMLKRTDPRWYWALSLTGPVLGQAQDASPRAALVGRISRSLSWSIADSLHIGASGAYVLAPAKNRDGTFPVRFQEPTEVRVDDTSLIDTSEIAAAHASVLGVEFAAQRGPLFLQGEAFRFLVDRSAAAGGGKPHFLGWYLEGSWILTGEHRRFDASRAAFWFPTPARPLGQGGWGALELAFRFSRTDLNYEPGSPGEPPPPGGVRGGEQTILGAGLNWYPRRRVRVMLSYMHVTVDRLNPAGPMDPAPFGPPPATPPVGVQIGQTLDILATRLRYAF